MGEKRGWEKKEDGRKKRMGDRRGWEIKEDRR